MKNTATSFAKEFREFAMKGNVMDLAVGVIIGGAFGKIVSSLVKDVVMPPLGILLGGIDFTKWSVVLKESTDTAEAITLNAGLFIQAVVDFLIIAFAIFVMIRMLAKLKRKQEEEAKTPPPPSKEEVLLTEIRDLLKERK